MNTGGIRKLATAALTATLALPAMWGTTAGAEGASGGTTLGGQRAARVDVGDSHACAVADDGEVYCWGYNWAGQGGNGTTTDFDRPERVDALPAPGRAQAVAAGGDTTCALLVDGAVTCWGSDSDGQLGNGAPVGNVLSPPAPVTLPSPGKAVQISVGYNFACAVLTDGKVTCWGSDSNGQLGNGAPSADVVAPPAPVTLPSPGTAVSVSAGYSHACALLTDGKVTCWGAYSNGQLGNGAASADVITPPSPITLPSPGTAIAISAGDFHTCAVLAGGDVTCWGSGLSGALGNGSSGIVDVPPAPVSLPGGAAAVGVSAGPFVSCALLAAGDISCWGNGGHHMLGTGSLVNAMTPSPVVTLPGGREASAVAVGSHSVCAAVGAGISCWGDDRYGEAGVGEANGDNTLPSDPIDLPGVNPGAEIVAFTSGTCSRQSGGKVRCWGIDDDGQRGLGTSDAEAHDAPSGTAVTLPGVNSASSIDAGNEHVCAIQTDGSLACWGLDQMGQVGNGAGSSAAVLAPEAIALPSPGTAVDIGLGYAFSCAVLTGGAVTCWGDDSDGQLGNGGATGVVHAPPSPVTLPSPGTASKITAGRAFACAVLTDGKVTCWGDDGWGQLGNGSPSADVTAPPAPITLPSPGTATDVDAGRETACALLTDGHVACWGRRSSEQIGGSGSSVTTPVLVDLPSPGTALGISVGESHVCALLTNWHVACWGGGFDGTLGTGARIDQAPPATPVSLPGVGTAIGVSAGFNHTCALLTSGDATCWGLDEYGQLGNGGVDGDAVHEPSTLLNMQYRPSWVPDFSPLAPARLLDTRAGQQTIDGLFAGGGQRAAGSTLALTVAGRGSVAGTAQAALLNVTAVSPVGTGWVTVYPCGAAQPTASNLNVVAGVNVANVVVSQLGTDGQVCIFTSVATHLVVDVGGTAPLASAYSARVPQRFMETRVGAQFTTVDGQFQGAGQLAGGTITELQVTGRGTPAVPADAAAVVLNVTAVTSPSNGWVTVFPCGATQPTASNLNFVPGRSVANSVLVGVGTAGKVCVYNSSATHLIVDVVGVLEATAHSFIATPVRLLETRNGAQFTTFDHLFEGGGQIAAGQTVELNVGARVSGNNGVTFVWLNITSLQSSAGGYVIVHSCDVARPTASNLNFPAGTTVANAVVAELSDDGTVCIYTSATTHLVVDIGGIVIDGYAPLF